jgi:hypothetical protein
MSTDAMMVLGLRKEDARIVLLLLRSQLA